MNTRYYSTIITNDLLGRRKEIKGRSLAEVNIRRSLILAGWKEEEKRAKERETLTGLSVFADFDSEESAMEIDQCRNLMRNRLRSDEEVAWDRFYSNETFPAFEFEEPITFETVCLGLSVPKEQKKVEAILTYKVKLRMLAEEKARVVHNQILEKYEARRREALAEYETKRGEFERNQKQLNEELDSLSEGLKTSSPEALHQLLRLAMVYHEFPVTLERIFEVRLDQETKTAIVDFLLPLPEDVPSIIRYDSNHQDNELVPVTMPNEELERFYESTIHQIVLRTMYDIFKAVDSQQVQNVTNVAFNGWVWQAESDKGAGYTCIITARASRQEFLSLDLTQQPNGDCISQLQNTSCDPLIQLKPVEALSSSSPECLDPFRTATVAEPSIIEEVGEEAVADREKMLT